MTGVEDSWFVVGWLFGLAIEPRNDGLICRQRHRTHNQVADVRAPMRSAHDLLDTGAPAGPDLKACKFRNVGVCIAADFIG